MEGRTEDDEQEIRGKEVKEGRWMRKKWKKGEDEAEESK